jgi:replicative superfamily II helicase
MKDGTAIYHVYGGYTIIADTRSRSLNMALKMLYECLKNGKESEDDTLPDAMCHVLSLPMIAFSDAEFTYKLATVMLEWINNVYENSMSSELKAEDPDAMRELQEDMSFRKTIKDALS